jgi:hypothetical protein
MERSHEEKTYKNKDWKWLILDVFPLRLLSRKRASIARLFEVS